MELVTKQELTLTFFVPDTDFSMLSVELALTYLRPRLPSSKYDGSPDAVEITCAYEVLQRIWQRYCETVPEAAEWVNQFPPLPSAC